jgi:citrate lyase subunit beta / citryl-CoA lyase
MRIELAMTTPPRLKMRSWLFAPGDSEKKIAKAAGSAADIAILDLEDAVVADNKPLARTMIHDFLRDRTEGRERIWVRINPLDGPYTLGDLAAIMPARPGGIVLPKSRGRHDAETVHRYLEAFEAAHGIARGSTPVLALVTETAEGMLRSGDYQGAPRVAAMSWGAEDLADSLGASGNTNPDGSYSHVFELARSMCLLGSAAAGVPAI